MLDYKGKENVRTLLALAIATTFVILVPSPPLSPTHGHDEASNVGAILESVCNTKEVSSKAIAKLCDHVKADQQEQQVATRQLRK